ncbi:phosphatidylserine decarboxylase proenzyme 2-like isoform X2 [Chenopodium quinoa]|uniref:phosphatidylserine decarboxylase proenzyme 2-like isoform X2 n=1 Tax=Chenopodium quinoa TaxID=63459 RepID=UPI000B77C77A|nr:phosphatidylserine decarboxylase proenzyme 2-like isoform X2 [Chenopodium quinoa]
MGHGSSKDSSPSSSQSRRAKLRQKLRRDSRSKQSGNGFKLVSADDFAGIALLTLISAKMTFKDKWLACVTLGEQTFRTDITDQTEEPVWNSEKKLLLESNGPHIARVTVYETNLLKKNNLIGYCDINLFVFLTQDLESDIAEVDLLDPSSTDVVGKLSFSCYVEDPEEIEKDFARRILSIGDYNEDGCLSFSEFSQLIDAFGNQAAADKKDELFRDADKNRDGVVSIDELASLLSYHQEKEPLINSCPVCGELLDASNQVGSMVHMTLCFNEGTRNNAMSGGFLTDKQASYGWLLKLSEWAQYSSYGIGLHSGSKAGHILVFDRTTKRLVEELIDGKIILAMRSLYQNKPGLYFLGKGGKEIMQKLSEKQGEKMNSAESTKEIPKFIELFKDQLNLSETKYPLDHFKTFNEFFIRELKPGARPIAFMDRDDIAVCGADSRLTAFKNVEDSTRFWVKGRKFSIQGLLGNDVSASHFIGGALVIFRLAPQDYHRFHLPVSGTIERFVHIPGCLYTVNPIAVNSLCDVFTENKRAVSIISTSCFGKVAFVAIGATMVGSITFTREKGDYVQKGEEFGYFSFGGSTVICVFEKGAIKLDEDLLDNSARSLETLVRVGMTLGVSAKTNMR